MKISKYIGAFFAVSFLGSQNIIIFNEETLVALSFIAFVFFIYYFYGNTIQESFNERGDGIQLELQNLGVDQLNSLDHLCQEHKKISVLPKGINSIEVFTMQKLIDATSRAQTIFNTISIEQMRKKLKTLSLSQINIQQKLQRFLAKDIVGVVYIYHSRANSKRKGKTSSFNRKQIQQTTNKVVNVF